MTDPNRTDVRGERLAFAAVRVSSLSFLFVALLLCALPCPGYAQKHIGTLSDRRWTGIDQVAFSPNGMTLAAVLRRDDQPLGAALLFFDVETQQEVARVKLKQTNGFLRYTPDGKRLLLGRSVSSTRWGVAVWEVAGLKWSHDFDLPEGVEGHGVSLTPDSKSLVFLCKGEVFVYDLATGRKRSSFKVNEKARMMDLSPDGKQVALGSSDGRVRLYSVQTGKELWAKDVRGDPNATEEQRTGVGNFAFSRDGKLLSCGYAHWAHPVDKAIMVLRVSDGKQLLRGNLPNHLASRLAFSGDQRTLIAASSRLKQQLYLLDVASCKEIPTPAVPPLADESAGRCLALSPDGRTLAVVGSRAIRLWRLPPLKKSR